VFVVARSVELGQGKTHVSWARYLQEELRVVLARVLESARGSATHTQHKREKSEGGGEGAKLGITHFGQPPAVCPNHSLVPVALNQVRSVSISNTRQMYSSVKCRAKSSKLIQNTLGRVQTRHCQLHAERSAQRPTSETTPIPCSMTWPRGTHNPAAVRRNGVVVTLPKEALSTSRYGRSATVFGASQRLTKQHTRLLGPPLPITIVPSTLPLRSTPEHACTNPHKSEHRPKPGDMVATAPPHHGFWSCTNRWSPLRSLNSRTSRIAYAWPNTIPYGLTLPPRPTEPAPMR